ncbi:MAG: extracellular solute-binding protein [Nitrospirota bacterium]|nr:extracellular solute-binding protein [Nitrospirota bacterium]
MISLLSAFLRGDWVERVLVLSAVLALTAFIMLLGFGPERFHLSAPKPVQPLVGFVRRYPWRTLVVVFFLTTITLLALNLASSSPGRPSERITFVVSLDDTELIVFRDILDDLEPELGAQVFLMNIDPSRLVPRLNSMVASGYSRGDSDDDSNEDNGDDNNPMKWDLVAVDNNILGLLAAKGLVEELSEITEPEDVVPEPLLPSIRPLLEFEDRFYFAPFRGNVKIAYYNERKFAQYGLEPPRTWEELLEVARVFKEKEGVGRVAIQGHPGPPTSVTAFEFVAAAGGDPLTLDDEGSRKAFQFLKDSEPDLALQYIDTRFDTANELLIDDEVYLVDNWTFGIKVVIEDAGKGEIKVYSGWKGPDGERHVLGGDLLAVPKGAPHPDKAIKLIQLLQTSETQRAFLTELRWLPVRLDVLTNVPDDLKPHFSAINNALALSEARPIEPQWPIIEDCLDRAFGAVIREGGDIDLLEEYSSILKEIPQFIRYVVQDGDTFRTIAARHRTTQAVLAETNRTTIRAPLATGEILIVLPGLTKTCSDVS